MFVYNCTARCLGSRSAAILPCFAQRFEHFVVFQVLYNLVYSFKSCGFSWSLIWIHRRRLICIQTRPERHLGAKTIAQQPQNGSSWKRNEKRLQPRGRSLLRLARTESSFRGLGAFGAVVTKRRMIRTQRSVGGWLLHLQSKLCIP